MKNRITPTQHEVKLAEDDFIVSKTDPSGRITYANRALMKISGFKEEDLIGVQHNILRHPDMPRSVYKLMWDTITNGKECFAYVKNLCKNGDHYWVLANVTPDYDLDKKITGYFSCRRRPREEAVRKVDAVYAEILAAEHAAGTRDAIAAGTKVLERHIQQGHDCYEKFILSL